MSPKFYLPAELWLYVHRQAVPNIEASLDDTPDKALSDSDMKEYHEAACALSLVCKLWSQLAHELVYENVCVNDRFASLTAALDRPETARLVRRIRLSPNHCDHNLTILRQCTQVEVVVQPEFPLSECRGLTLSDAPGSLPALPNLRHLYWIQSRRSSALLQSVLDAATPTLTHIALSTSWHIGTDPNWAPTLPSSLSAYPNLSSLALTRLTPPCVRAFLLTADLSKLDTLTIDPMYFRCPDFPVLTSVRELKLVAPTEVPLGRIFATCPNVRELTFDVRSRVDFGFERGDGAGGALACVRLTLPRTAFAYTAGRGRNCGCESEARVVERQLRSLLKQPIFGKLRRVVLEWGAQQPIDMEGIGKDVLHCGAFGRSREGGEVGFGVGVTPSPTHG